MSELLNARQYRKNFRHNLLANASLLALLGYLGASQVVVAASTDDDRPTVWIELGGQFERTDLVNQVFSPTFLDHTPAADLKPMIAAQAPSPFSIGGEGKITFEPTGTDWILSASILYGRVDGAKHLHQQTGVPYVRRYRGRQALPPLNYQQFGDGQASSKETHSVLDFKAGKDVGLGLFGGVGTSVVSAGVRFAQFASSSKVALNARPENKNGAIYSGTKYLTSAYANPPGVLGYRTVNNYRRTYAASLLARRSTHAFGPSISWDASLPVAGGSTSMTLAFDWGLNAAVLFGRQRAQIQHHTSGQYNADVGRLYKYADRHPIHSGYVLAPVDRNRARAVTIPNVGGFAGVSLSLRSAKVAVGYRADFFFGAVDSGIDSARETNVGFYGPFATVSVGLP